MCGILGVVGRAIEPPRLERMALASRHRGPDAGGMSFWAEGGFAHRRLSIIDTSAAANQPFADPAGRATLVFNGEIYNYRELRTNLESRGHAFRTTSDTEVLLAAYLEWGRNCVERLNGMFAFAVWDHTKQELFAARDRLGKKPFFFARLPDGALLFASELKPLLASDWVSADPDPEALLDYLNLNYVLCPRTPLRQVRQLPPAHTAVWKAGTWSESRYWDLADSYLADRLVGDDAALQSQLEHLCREATVRRLASDVPLGAFLSGGVDSSLVVALMREGTQDLHTFSVEYARPEFDESQYSRLAAAHLGTKHHPCLADEQIADLLPEFSERMDMPLGDDSAVSVYLLARWARKQVTVALTGDGADELFAGYVTYNADALHRKLGFLRPAASWALGVLGPWLPEAGAKLSRRFQAEQLRRGLATDAPGAHFAWRQVGRPEDWGQALASDLTSAARGYSPQNVFREYHDRVRQADWLDRMLYVDCRTWLPDDILVKADRATMAASLEARSPFLDYQVAEFAARLPARLKLVRGRKKVVLKNLARKYLPAEITDRRKAGFNSPTTDWLRGPLRAMAEDVFRSDALESLGLGRAGVTRMWEPFLRGDRRNQYALWGLLCLGLWQRQVLGNGHQYSGVRSLRAA